MRICEKGCATALLEGSFIVSLFSLRKLASAFLWLSWLSIDVSAKSFPLQTRPIFDSTRGSKHLFDSVKYNNPCMRLWVETIK